MLPAAILLIGSTSVLGQVLPSAVGPGAFVAVGGGVSGFRAVYGQRDLVGGYVYADVQPRWRWGFEGEARFLRFHTSEGVKEANYLGGARGLIFRFHGLEPYGKFLVGMGKIKFPFDDGHGSFLSYAPGGGLDIALGENVTVRAIDFEYQHWPQFPYGSFSPYGISSSIRIRVTPLARIPQSVRKRALKGPALEADSAK
jgi:opacity protein-like surface antigen